MSPSVQAQLCTLNTDNVPLSCIYLSETYSPGPVAIDIDTADHQPFRFAFSVIKFDLSSGGLIAIDDISYTGLLCHEKAPVEKAQEASTIQPPISLEKLFQLHPFPQFPSPGSTYSESLNCDFEHDYCAHWSNGDVGVDGERQHLPQQFQYGTVPERIPMPQRHLYKGNAAIATFAHQQGGEEQFAILTSQLISCAKGAKITVTYYASDGAKLSICAEEKCVSPKMKHAHGNVSVTLNAQHPFRIR